MELRAGWRGVPLSTVSRELQGTDENRSLLADGVAFDVLRCCKDDHLQTSEYSQQGKYKEEVTSTTENGQTSYFKNQSLDLTLSDYTVGNPEICSDNSCGTHSLRFPLGLCPSGKSDFLGTSLGQIFPDNSYGFSTVCPRQAHGATQGCIFFGF